MRNTLMLLIGFCLSISLLASTAYSEIDFSKARSLPQGDGTIRFENVIVNGEPYWTTHRVYNKGVLVPIQAGKLSTFQIPTANIVIDGDPSDWAGLTPAYIDPEHDQIPPDGHPGTDIKEVFLARDNEFLYAAFELYDGDPADVHAMYITELQQYLGQVHTAGDTIINALYADGYGWQVSLSHRETNGAGSEYDSSHVGVGAKFIEYKVPIDDIEYDGYGVFAPMGIEGRFIRSYCHYCPDGVCDNGVETIDFTGDDDKLMIVDFY